MISPTASRRSLPARCRSRRRAAAAHPQARQAGHDAADAGQPEHRHGQSGNVIAEVPGRDPQRRRSLVGGHLDSWDLGTGAIDDGAGVAIAAAAAKRIMDAGRPLRTIRVVWFGAEEVGLFGGLDYREAPRQGAASRDRRKRFRRRPHLEGRQQARQGPRGRGRGARQAALAPLGIVTGAFDEADGSDIGPMIEAGVPGVGLSQDGTRYFDLHHTPDDTLDKIDPEAAAAECRGVDGDAGGAVGRDRAGAETAASGVEPQNKEKTQCASDRLPAAAARRLPGQQGRGQRHDQRRPTTRTSPRMPRPTSATPPRKSPRTSATTSSETGDKVAEQGRRRRRRRRRQHATRTPSQVD